MEKRKVEKFVRNGIISAAIVASMLVTASCKKEAPVNPVSAGHDQSKMVVNTLVESGYKVSEPISLNGAHDITISDYSISGGAVSCIDLANCYNIHITHCALANPGKLGINLSNCTNIQVDQCDMADVKTDVYSINGKGILVTDNKVPEGRDMSFENIHFDGAE
jgi:parallel beta helix pectate lyase-like protein